MRQETADNLSTTKYINNKMTGHQGKGGKGGFNNFVTVGCTSRAQIMSLTDEDLATMSRKDRRMVKKARAYWAKR